MGSVNNLYIYLSVGEENSSKDANFIHKRLNNFNNSDVLICISRDYLADTDKDLPENTVVIRDQLCNVFPSIWSSNSREFPLLKPLCSLQGEFIPPTYFLTNQKELYNEIDYFLHLSEFGNRFKIFVQDGELNIAEKIRSQMSREDMILRAKLLNSIYRECGWHNGDSIKQPPGFAMQIGDLFLSRLIHARRFVGSIRIDRETDNNLRRYSVEEFIDSCNKEIWYPSAKTNCDLTLVLTEKTYARKMLAEMVNEFVDESYNYPLQNTPNWEQEEIFGYYRH